MMKVKYRNFHPGDAQAMSDLQHRSLEHCPDTGKFEAGFWFSPGFQEGLNIMIAETARSRFAGYAAILSAYYSNTLEARVLWIDLRTDSNLDCDSAIKDRLLEKIVQRGREIKIEENRDRAAISATYFAQWEMSIDYGYPLGRLDLLEHFTKSELWHGGTSFTAFAEQEIIASVMALSNGLIDYVFVIPDWRGKGIAKILIAEALEFLRDQRHSQAWLDVYAHNQAAINLYHQFGFESFKEEISLGYLL